jgi:hypothetical protein
LDADSNSEGEQSKAPDSKQLGFLVKASGLPVSLYPHSPVDGASGYPEKTWDKP